MKPTSLQEKFQITVPPNHKAEDNEGAWASFESARDVNGTQEFCPANAGSVDMHRFNKMPPGMELHNQCDTEQRQMPLSMAGETDVSQDTNPTAFAEGFKKRDMKGDDDQYTGEHMDHFYGDAGGFVERNNYLDRE